MRLISRISIRYDRVEDRLRLDLIEKGGQPLALWLTWRLANVLVDGLLGTVQEFAAPSIPETSRASQAPAASKSDANQFWAQTRAEMGLSRSPRREPQEVRPGDLVHRLAMRRPASGDHFFLELYWAEESVVVPISETYMRQLLTLLHRSYHAAGWSPKGAWPVWLGEEAHRTVLDSSEIN